MWEQNSRWTGAKPTYAKRVLTPMHQYQKCNQKKRKYRRRREPAHHFDDKCMFHQSLGKGTRFLFWVGIFKARKGPTFQVWVQKCPMHCPASTCRLLPCPDAQRGLSVSLQHQTGSKTSLYTYKRKAAGSHQEEGQWKMLQITFNSYFLSSFGLSLLIL